MSRDTVMRMRCSEEEKAAAEAKASDRGFASLSDLLRNLLGFPTRSETPSSALTSGNSRKAKSPAKKKAAAKEAAKETGTPAKENGTPAPEAESKDGGEGPGNKAINELAVRLRNREGLTSPAAKRKAKAMLEGEDE